MEKVSEIATRATLIGRFSKASEKKSFSPALMSLMNEKLGIFESFMMVMP